jgi:hypothetical protein
LTFIQEKDACYKILQLLFRIAKMRNLPKYPSTVESVKKAQHTSKIEYHSARKRKGILPFATIWMTMEALCQVKSSKHKNSQIPCDLTYMWDLKMLKSQKQRVEGWILVAGDQGCFSIVGQSTPNFH